MPCQISPNPHRTINLAHFGSRITRPLKTGTCAAGTHNLSTCGPFLCAPTPESMGLMTPDATSDGRDLSSPLITGMGVADNDLDRVFRLQQAPIGTYIPAALPYCTSARTVLPSRVLVSCGQPKALAPGGHCQKFPASSHAVMIARRISGPEEVSVAIQPAAPPKFTATRWLSPARCPANLVGGGGAFPFLKRLSLIAEQIPALRVIRCTLRSWAYWFMTSFEGGLLSQYLYG